MGGVLIICIYCLPGDRRLPLCHERLSLLLRGDDLSCSVGGVLIICIYLSSRRPSVAALP